jgi:serine/threonine protein kinase
MPALGEQQQFERYRIYRWSGNSVSGESYEAIDTMLQRKVTLKLIHPWFTLPESARRQFFREMQGISLLNHPYLASVLDYGELDGQLYVVRRYVSSGSLLSEEGRQWYQSPLPVADAISYAQQLAQALAHVHQHGYLHGSLTFSNILVLRGKPIDRQPDFAPFLLADVGLTHFVRRFGQPPYSYLPLMAAPEQIGKRVTPASDQYALAVILYFWLAGRPPFVGTPEEIEHMKLTETLPPLSALNPNVTSEQEGMLRRALAVYPEERYPSITTFADALAATLTPTSYQTTQHLVLPDTATPPTSQVASTLSVIPDTEPPIPLLDQIPNPEPLPTPAPEPLPQPAPEPLPTPVPEPLPQPAPEPSPVPAPEPLPQPAPDVFTPDTDPTPITPPQTDVSNEPGVSTTDEPAMEQQEQQAAKTYLVATLPSTGQTYEFVLESEEIAIGRAGNSDILLEEDTLASRHHAMLKREGDSYRLYDLRSANGVSVNGQKVPVEEGYQLAHGDSICIGSYEFVFHQPVSALQCEPA